jgi:pimeloyl-ACP methyl ester carboxylesterase
VQTSDGVGLDGLLVKPATGGQSRLPLDVVIMHHGVAGRFYRHRVFDPIMEQIAAQGCAALCVNNRGHDTVFTTEVQGKTRMLGAAYEIVDDCRYDWDAWIGFAAAQGYRRIGLWGHSLGAVKSIYYLAVQPDPRVVCAIASSPPRQNYENYLAQPDDERALFQQELAAAEGAVEEGDPARLIQTTYRRRTIFAARTFIDKYGPASRYDIFQLIPKVQVPLFLTWGGLEPLPSNTSHVSFHELPAAAARFAAAHSNVGFAEIEGADHGYTGRTAQLWAAALNWYRSSKS